MTSQCSISYTCLPKDVVENVIGSFDAPVDIIQRRRLGEVWYRRYVQRLPWIVQTLGLQEIVDLALNNRDEALMLDILTLTDGNVGENEITDIERGILTTTTLLHRLMQAGFSQAFGDSLTKFATFVTNTITTLVEYMAKREWDHWHPEAMYGTEWSHIERLVASLLYFDALSRRVFLPWIRRNSTKHILLFASLNDITTVSALLDLFERYRLPIYQFDMGNIIRNYHDHGDDWANQIVSRLDRYPNVLR